MKIQSLSQWMVITSVAAFLGISPCLGQTSSALKYRFAGPPGNRADAIAGVPSNPFVAYVGAASGGVWKTTNGGASWRSIFNHEPVQSVGAIAVSPSRPNQVWVGTGESFYIRPETSIGDGVWFSSDAGKRWRHVGLDQTGRIASIAVDPDNSKIVYVCAAGSGFGPSQHRGVYRTTNGGQTWQRVLYVNSYTGCSDLAMDLQDPNVVFAGMWQFDIHPWRLDSGGPGGGVFVSRDGGSHWSKLSSGLPTGSVGKVGVAISRSNPQVVYALISEKHHPGLYRSTDGGEQWRLVSQDHTMMERPPYYGHFIVAPQDSKILYFTSVWLSRSRNGGKTLKILENCGCGDTHNMWIDPRNPKNMWVVDDLGVVVTHDGGQQWHRSRLPIAQMYHVYTDNAIPYHIMGNRQDGFSYWGPSDSLTPYGITPGDWHNVGGCESGFTVPDPYSDTVWSGCYEGGLTRFNLKTMHGQDVRVWPIAGYGWPPRDVKNRWNWTMPIAVAPWKPHPVFVGSQYVYKTTNGGHSWTRISPDLTRNIKAHELASGGIVTDQLGTFVSDALSIIAPSKRRANVLWVGSYDGLVHLSRNGGRTWKNVTPRMIQRLGGDISSISPSPFKAGVAWITVDRHLFGDSKPYIFRTTDYGRSWTRINRGIPHSVFSYVHCVALDPARKGMAFAGTENGVYVTFDYGKRWRPLQENLPHAPVYWLTVQPEFHDLVIATFGRGFWILDDVKPLESAGFAALQVPKRARLLAPRVTWRLRLRAGTPGPAAGSVVGQNPPYGALIDYLLPNHASSNVRITIADRAGRIIRTFSTHPHGSESSMQARPGLNRLDWNLRYPHVPAAKLRRPPPHAPWDRPAPGKTRRIVSWDLDLTQRGPLVPPGRYRVTLTVGRQQFHQQLVIKKDPNTAGTLQDIQEQTRLSLSIYRDLRMDVRTINQIEWLRQELHDLVNRLQARSAPQHLVGRVEHADRVLLQIEDELFNVDLTGAREDAFRNPMRLYGRLSALLREVETESSDYAPTVQQRQASKLLSSQLNKSVQAYQAFVNSALPALNAELTQHGVQLLGPVGTVASSKS